MHHYKQHIRSPSRWRQATTEIGYVSVSPNCRQSLREKARGWGISNSITRVHPQDERQSGAACVETKVEVKIKDSTDVVVEQALRGALHVETKTAARRRKSNTQTPNKNRR